MLSDQYRPEKGESPTLIDDAWETEAYDPLADALELAAQALRLTTGHDRYQRLKVAYWILATHFLPVFDPFPGLAVFGPPTSGKSATIDVIHGLAMKVVKVTGSTLTEAALKASMAQAERGTLVIDEADQLSTQLLEDILITRYSLSTGIWRKMVTPGDGQWRAREFRTSGATALHRRNLFRDPALSRRIIPVRTIRIKGKYAPVTSCIQLFEQFRALDIFNSSLDANGNSSGEKLPKLPQVENAWDIEPGIFDCYRPLIVLATYLSDHLFLAQLRVEMEAATERLMVEENYLEAPTLLHTLINLANEEMKNGFTTARLAIEVSKIEPAILREYGHTCPLVGLAANQRNRILREDLGFEVVSAGGRMRVRFTIPQLMAQCNENNIKDELLDEWDAELKKLEGKDNQ